MPGGLLVIPLSPTEFTTLKITICKPLVMSPNCYDQYDLIPCNTESRSGGAGVTRNHHSLGSTDGHVVISYEMYSIPDAMDVYYEGTLVATTGGPVSHTGTLEFDYVRNIATWCTTVVTGPNGTEWRYTLACPV